MKEYTILTINPGSTSTKYTLYKGEQIVLEEKVAHSEAELKKYEKIFDQYEFRKDLILKSLQEKNINIKDLDAVVGRGGLLKPIPGGTYEVNEKMLDDLRTTTSEHASNLGAPLAYNIAKDAGVKAYIVDPVVVDEFAEVARISGNKNLERRSIFHALNQRAIAKQYAKEIGKKYDELNLVVVHMGGGISLGAHMQGKVVDNNNALDGEGPFTPERSGTLPAGQLVELCFSGKHPKAEIKKMLKGQGGMISYIGTNDMLKVEQKALAGDKESVFYSSAMAYQIAKEIGAYATIFKGKLDAILLTGGLANNKVVTDEIIPRVEWISKVKIYPHENEMQALMLGAYNVLTNEEKVQIYS